MTKDNTTQLEYRVRRVERFIVTRFSRTDENSPGTVEERGEYENPEVAHEVAYALCKREHEILGWPIDDMRIRYPEKRNMDADLIKRMVDRFLGWPLPIDFSPDNGISFDPTYNKHMVPPPMRNPVGTNLFTADQATAMVRHLLSL